MKLLGVISVGFSVIFCNETAHHLFINFKKAHDSVRREVLYNVRFEVTNQHLIQEEIKRRFWLCLLPLSPEPCFFSPDV
jgi:hypothetical protein